MKAKVTISVDRELISAAQAQAQALGISLSDLIEEDLRRRSRDTHPPFSVRWRGKFHAPEREEPRFEALAKKYL